MTTTPNFGFELFLNPQPNASVLVNLFQFWLDHCAKVFLVENITTATPPGSPADGACYLVAASPTGAWAGKAGNFALWFAAGSAWLFKTPKAGDIYWNKIGPDNQSYDGTNWANRAKL